MTPAKEDIKKWLKDIGKDRFWLADKCSTGKRAVDKWFEKKGEIPSKAILLLQGLMREYPSPITQLLEESDSNEEEQEIVLSFTDDEWSIMERFKESYPNKSIENYCREKALEFCIGMNDAVKKTNPVKLVSAPSFTPIQTFKELYEVEVIGNIAAGGLADGDTEPYAVKADQPLANGEYVLRVNGKSMEPDIMDGSLVVMRKHTVPPIPKLGTIVEYHDERGVTIKKLAQRKTEDGKKQYILHSINPAFPDILPMDGGKISAVYLRTLSSLHHSA